MQQQVFLQKELVQTVTNLQQNAASVLKHHEGFYQALIDLFPNIGLNYFIYFFNSKIPLIIIQD